MTKKPPSQPVSASASASEPEPEPASNPAPRPARNPAPRPALPRRTLGPHGAQPADEAGGPTDVDAWVAEARSRTADPQAAEPAPLAGRDALLPPVAEAEARKPAAEEPPRARTGRATIPSLSELMPRSVPSAVRPTPPSTVKKPKKHKREEKPTRGHDTAADPQVELVVPVTKSLRKRLKSKAAMSGMSPEEATALLVSVWVDG
ncbi:MAG TPA: hypothetical protein VIM19_16850 [Actinomycetes bacterium]